MVQLVSCLKNSVSTCSLTLFQFLTEPWIYKFTKQFLGERHENNLKFTTNGEIRKNNTDLYNYWMLFRHWSCDRGDQEFSFIQLCSWTKSVKSESLTSPLLSGVFLLLEASALAQEHISITPRCRQQCGDGWRRGMSGGGQRGGKWGHLYQCQQLNTNSEYLVNWPKT